MAIWSVDVSDPSHAGRVEIGVRGEFATKVKASAAPDEPRAKVSDPTLESSDLAVRRAGDFVDRADPQGTSVVAGSDFAPVDASSQTGGPEIGRGLVYSQAQQRAVAVSIQDVSKRAVRDAGERTGQTLRTLFYDPALRLAVSPLQSLPGERGGRPPPAGSRAVERARPRPALPPSQAGPALAIFHAHVRQPAPLPRSPHLQRSG